MPDLALKTVTRTQGNNQALKDGTVKPRGCSFVFEEVGQFIDQSNPDLYLFSSDYPHIEGGRNPIGRFEGALEGRSEAVKELFYAENFLRIFPKARV